MAYDPNYPNIPVGPFDAPQLTNSPITGTLQAPSFAPISMRDPNATPVRTFMGMPDMSAQMAQYQSIANNLISPYNVVGRNSWLAQTHPHLAGILDAGATAAAMTPEARGPEGVGGGISRTFQGLMGAEQLNRQKMMQAALLPYQMMMPQLQAQNLISEIGARESEIPYRHAMENRAEAQADWYMHRMDQPQTKTPMVDTSGNAWMPEELNGEVRLRNLASGQLADPNSPPEFQTKQSRVAGEFGGGALGNILAMKMSDDPAIRAKGEAAGQAYVSLTGQQASARTAGEQNAPHPQVDANRLNEMASQTVGKNIFKPRANDPLEYITKGFATSIEEAQKLYNDDRKRASDEYKQTQQWASAYVASGVSKRGVSYQDWLAQQKANGLDIGAADQFAGQAPVSTPAKAKPEIDSGSNWTPK